MSEEWQRETDETFRAMRDTCDRINARLDRMIATCDQIIEAIHQMQRDADTKPPAPPVGFV